MALAGYSGTPLIKKLGIKPGMKIFLIFPPGNYFELLETDISDQLVLKNKTPDLIHLFAKDDATFKEAMKPVLKKCSLNSSVIIWVSWYKKSSGIATDLTEDIIRQFALGNNLVDVKVCAVSAEWSGLKLVVPVSKR
ncbi:MAG: DUF3052 domain-containing protein [Chitinophagaceae bacterium]|nr:DUF3052 domain-containing protein [Chitinophagaceae bacterium]